MLNKKSIFLLALLCLNLNIGYTQRPSSADDEESNPLLDIASVFIQQALNNNGGGGGGAGGNGAGVGAGLAGVASLIGTFMQANAGQSKNGGGGGSGAMQIISGISSLLANSAGNTNGGGGGFDPSIIGNVLEMFTQGDDAEEDDDDENVPAAAPTATGRHHHQQKRSADSGGIDLGSILQIASAFMGQNNQAGGQQQHHQHKRSANAKQQTPETAQEDNNNLMTFLPLVMQAISSFTGAEGKETQDRHKDHAWVLPPFLEHLHVLWDHFSHSDLADALYEKSGVNKILKGFKGRDGHVDYDKLFESLNNQSFRRRWIKSATLYLADWASYFANPEIYSKYFQTGQMMFNGFLKSQGYPKNTFFEPSRPAETLSNLFDHVAKQHLSVKIDSRQYVKPAVSYAKEFLKLGQARGLLQFNSTEISDKLTDTLNLEVIEPVLKVHRAYRFISKQPQCDQYVLCQLNDPQQYAASSSSNDGSRGLMSAVSPKIVKIGSMGAAFVISTKSGTPFWTLFSVINAASNCEVAYPVDCTGFHEGEAKVTTEYIHNEL